MRLTTFRRSGEGVPTTVWFALVEGRAYVFTAANSGKAKRIRNEPRVTLTPSNFRGRPRAAVSIEAEARIMERGEEEMPDRAIDRLRLAVQALHPYPRTTQNLPEHVFLELRTAEDPQ